MLKPSGGFLKKLFDPARMARKKKPVAPTAEKPVMPRRERGDRGFISKALGREA